MIDLFHCIRYTIVAEIFSKGGEEMIGQFFFEIPNDVEIMAKLVLAVPSNWSWIDGILVAPDELIASGKAIADTGIGIMRFHSISPTIRGRYNPKTGGEYDPDLYGILVDQKLPGFVRFDEAGFRTSLPSVSLAQKIAVGYLRKGYCGHLTFFEDCYDSSKYNNPAVCKIVISDQERLSVEQEGGFQPSSIELEWNTRYGGKQEDVERIATVCRSLELKEFAIKFSTKQEE